MYEVLWADLWAGATITCMQTNPRRTIHLRLPASMAEAVKDTAEREGATMNTYLVAVIASAIDWPAKPNHKEGPRDADTSEGPTTPETPDDAARS